MNQAFEIASIGLSTQQKALDTIANNVANMSTPAFKRSALRFSEVLSPPADPSHPDAGLQQVSVAGGARADAVAEVDAQGAIAHTGKPLDLAIDGKGFIELLSPDGTSLLWRGGTLTLHDGALAAQNGMPLRAMLNVPEDAQDISIGQDGAVNVLLANGTVNNIGTISLVRVEDPSQLQRLDGGLYRPADDMRLQDVKPGEGGAGLLVQGGLEQSNVQLNDEMVQLMMVQRAYAANSQIVQAADQLAAMANNLKQS